MIKKIAILTSGGDAPGMNACIRAIVQTAAKKNITALGIQYGYKGLMEGLIVELNPQSVRNIVHKGGTILKTNRCKEFRNDSGRKKAYKIISENNIQGLIVLGGDGSFAGASIFCKEFKIPVIGIPCTIDNDIFGTDYSIGFDTAVETIIDSVDKIRDTASSHDRIFFIEVMGRNSGHLALSAGNATGAELILIPEKKIKNFATLIKKIKQINQKKESIIIIYAEGCNLRPIEKVVRKVEKGILNSNVRFSILGHIQRGGSPSKKDRITGSLFGYHAINELINNKKNIMIGLKNEKIVNINLEESIKNKKKINSKLIDLSNFINNY